jgi:hypothetical protein
MSHNITVEGGTSVRLPTAGKYCDRDIVITATGSGGGGTDIEDELITHTLSAEAYSNDRINTVGYGAFYGSKNLKSVSLPNVTSVGGYAFYQCSALEELNLPLMQSAGTYAFTSIKVPVLYFPVLETITTYTFNEITTPTKVIMPRLKTAGNSSFRNSKGIVFADLAVCTKVDNLCFYFANGLKTLILRNTETMCTLQNTNAFTGTEIAKGTGYVYFPRKFLSDDNASSDYRRANNWSTLAAQFRILEDFTVDGTTTGALDESKI